MRDFELEIVSHHPQFKNQVLRPYFVEGIDTIGVWGEEPFELRFRNNTDNKVQVRLSVDGTDVLTGSVADVSASGKMWVVNPRDSLSLEAWPETNEKGARFVFGKTANSVAANTHGDLSSKGIIGAAVFVEGYVPPRRTYGGDIYYQGGGGFGMSYNSAGRIGSRSRSDTYKYQLVDCCDAVAAGSLESLDADPAVGAGETVKQAIGTASGLVQPRLSRVVSARYIWWDDLKAKLDAMNAVFASNQHPTGFKGHSEKTLINLGQTPRVDRVRHAVVQTGHSRTL